MLAIKVNNEYLDLLPGTQMEVEENNSFLQFGDEVVGEYSFPFDVPNTAKNNRLLNYAGVIQKNVNNTGIDALVYDSGFQHSKGRLKFEKIQHNLNHGPNNRLSCYYLTGSSYFWQDVKDKNLRHIDLGGPRTFAWDNYNRNGSGFWGHIHQVVDAAPGTYDYAFYSAFTDDFDWENGGTDWVNVMTIVGGQPTFSQTNKRRDGSAKDSNTIVPFPYLKKVLVKAIEYVGWKVEGAILNDPQFQKITLQNLRAIDWAIYKTVSSFSLLIPRSSITFNLIDHLPDMSIATFLFALRKRFGWWYDIDKVNKIIRIKDLSDIAISDMKDMSSKASPLIPKTILTETKIYSVRNNTSSSAISLEGLVYDGEVNVASALPMPAEALYGHVYLIRTENNYAICEWNDSANFWQWEFYQANTGDVAPVGATDEIAGNSSVSAIERNPLNNYGDFMPVITGSGFWPGRNDDNQAQDIQLCFYYGRRNDVNGRSFPFASHHIYDGAGVLVGTWSLALLAKDTAGNEIGLYERKWKPFLERLRATEELEVTLYLNRNDLMALKYSDAIVINGVKMYIKQRKYVIPYKNVLTLTCIRITK